MAAFVAEQGVHMGTTPGVRWGYWASLVAVSGLLGAILPAPRARAEDAPANSIPLPLTGRQTVRAGGKTYVIDGKQVIPGGSIIRVEANVRIVGINKASLEVQGGFLVHGTEDCWVHIENVDFSPTVAPDNEVHLDMADLYNCSFVSGEASVFDGGFTIENSALQWGCKFALRMRSGYLRIMTVNCKVPCTIDSTPKAGTSPEIAIRTSWMNAVTMSGDAQVTVRDSEIRGPLEARNFTTLVIDGCDLFGDLSLHQKAEGRFEKLQLLKCNLFGGSKIVLDRPVDAKAKMEKVRVAKFHFENGEGKADMTDKSIAERIDDGADNPAVSVKAYWQGPEEHKHFFLSESLKKRRPP